MILPGASRSRTATRGELIDAAAVGIDQRARRSIRTLIHRVSNSIAIRIGFSGERKAGVKGTLMCDVGPDAQPIGSKIVVSYPALQVGCERSAGRHNRLGRRKPQKVAAAQERLGAGEIVNGGEGESGGEKARGLKLLSR